MVFAGEVPKRFPPQIARAAWRKLTALDVAKQLEDLRQPPCGGAWDTGRRGVIAEMALMLAERFGTTAEFWMGLRMVYDLEQARRARAA